VKWPPQVQQWKDAMEREKRAAACLERWGLPLLLAVVACTAVAYAYRWGGRGQHAEL
jgi:hypothetical protein